MNLVLEKLSAKIDQENRDLVHVLDKVEDKLMRKEADLQGISGRFALKGHRAVLETVHSSGRHDAQGGGRESCRGRGFRRLFAGTIQATDRQHRFYSAGLLGRRVPPQRRGHAFRPAYPTSFSTIPRTTPRLTRKCVVR